MRVVTFLLAALAIFLSASPAHADPRIRVTVEGQGPDLILIPGLASSQDVWDPTVARLKSTHRIHRVRIAGFAGEPVAGNSEGPVVAPVVEELAAYVRANRLSRPAIIGHSLGGAAGLMLAARHPELVGRVMAVDSLPFYSLIMNPAATVETAMPQAVMMRDTVAAQTPEQAAAMQPAMMARLIRTESARAPAIAAALASDRSVMARAMYDMMTTDLRPQLASFRAPLTILYAYDPAFGVPAATIDALFRGAYAAAPTARLTRVDDSFHFIMLDQPAVFAAAVDAFLR